MNASVYDSTAAYPRDLIGYGRNPPHAQWPGQARVAVQFVLNYEEGSENSVLHGDAGSEQFLSEMFNPASYPDRHISMEGIYEYGSRAGVWRLVREFEQRKLPLTVFGVATALQKHPDVLAAFQELGYDIACHGLKWIHYQNIDEATERAHMAEAMAIMQKLSGERPLGWYTGRDSPRTRRLVADFGGFEYDSDYYGDDLPFWIKVEKTEKPEEIIGGSLYATRPDFYNRSTFTFTTKYNNERKPYGLLHYRANDEDLLNVLYKPTTVSTIREELNKLGRNDEIDFNKRWADFLDFNGLAVRGQYGVFPKNEPEDKYQFPLPDNEDFIALINDFIKWHNQTQGTQERTITSITSLNQILISQAVQEPMLAVYFIEQAIHNAFVPLTELPVIYDYIKGNSYVPVNKKQIIKDKNGNALNPTDADFDIAPMMKVISESENRVQFTDFNLDGNSQNIYFYAVREMDIKMNFGEFSDLLGPVKLVASTPPKTPEIKRIMPILENQILGIKPAVQIELNAYQPEYKIRKINIYRASTMLEAQSIRTMKLAKEIVVNEDTLSAEFENVWTVYDDFGNLEEVPFGDGLFYRITVSKQIEYADPESTTENPIINVDFAPSLPSKITATVIVDNVSPESPVLEATGTSSGINGEVLKPVVFNWEKTVYNGKYHLYKMNNQGNWEKIHEISTNLQNVVLPLQQTKLKTDELIIKNENSERIYHHFKVISENSSGMLSSDEKILTL